MWVNIVPVFSLLVSHLSVSCCWCVSHSTAADYTKWRVRLRVRLVRQSSVCLVNGTPVSTLLVAMWVPLKLLRTICTQFNTKQVLMTHFCKSRALWYFSPGAQFSKLLKKILGKSYEKLKKILRKTYDELTKKLWNSWEKRTKKLRNAKKGLEN